MIDRRLVSVAAMAAGLWAVAAHGAPPWKAESDSYEDLVYYDGVDEQGRLVGGSTLLRIGGVPAGAVRPAPVETLATAGNSANRIDLVLVGDGYTEADLDRWRQHAETLADYFFGVEPWIRYRPLFNVHRIDVISNESGVDNDPDQGISRDTAMDMAFWCSNIERLLCVNVNKAVQFARNAPDVDLIGAIANSTKYGGAGYIGSDLGTASGGNRSSGEILRHEFGHALGDLADEYDYGGPDRYQGPERPEPNVSIYTADRMQQESRKWHRWLGVSDPAFDGLIGTYEGGYYSRLGVYRPTNNSLMRNLGRPFNLPSVEAIVIEMYQIVRPIDDSSDPNTIYRGTEILFVDPVDPVGQPLSIRWLLNGVAIEGETGEILDLGGLSLLPGENTVSVIVVDDTPWVRDPNARSRWLTQRVDFTVGEGCRADFDGSGTLDGGDFLAFLAAFFALDPRADYNTDGRVDGGDFLAYLGAFFSGC